MFSAVPLIKQKIQIAINFRKILYIHCQEVINNSDKVIGFNKKSSPSVYCDVWKYFFTSFPYFNSISLFVMLKEFSYL